MENVKRTFAQRIRKEKVEIAERDYFTYEEVTHAVTHGVGALLSILGLVFF